MIEEVNNGGNEGKLTAVAHDHDFGINTELVPGPPVRIHARIGGHRVVHVERRGRAKVAQRNEKE